MLDFLNSERGRDPNPARQQAAADVRKMLAEKERKGSGGLGEGDPLGFATPPEQQFGHLVNADHVIQLVP